MTGSIPRHVHVTGMTGTIPLTTVTVGPRTAEPQKRAVPKAVITGKAEIRMLDRDLLTGPPTIADPFPGEVIRTLTENGT